MTTAVPSAGPVVSGTRLRLNEIATGRLLDWRPDAVTFLTAYLFLLFALPANLVIPTLGAAGRPADLLGLLGAGWWVLHGVVPGGHPRGAAPLRFVLMVRLGTILLSIAFGLERVLADGERLAVDRFLLATIAAMGVSLVAADGIRDRESLDRILRRTTYVGAFVAFVAFFQFMFSFDLTTHMKLPGLDFNADQYAIQTRGAFNRVGGTANHAIEFVVVIGMLLPLATHFVLFAPTKASFQKAAVILAIIASGIPFSVSRAGIVAFVMGMGTLSLVWNLRLRINAAVVTFLGMSVVYVSVPGLSGTIKNLFVFAGKDTSISARTDDYPIVYEMISERPWFGRGAGTWLVDVYFTLDNQILATLAQVGYIGLVAVLLVYGAAFAMARDTRYHAEKAQDRETRHLAQALAAMVIVSLATTVTFDSFGFPMHTGFVYLVYGFAAALWRIERNKRLGRDGETWEPSGFDRQER